MPKRTLIDEEMNERVAPSVKGEGLSEVAKAIRELLKREKRLERAKEKLADAQKAYDDARFRVVPDACDRAGVLDFTDRRGVHCKVRNMTVASIKAADRPKAFQWLRKNGGSALIKCMGSVSLSGLDRQTEESVRRALDGLPVDWDYNESVHPQTLGAWVRERLESRPTAIPPADSGIEVRSFQQAEIKRKGD